MATEKKRADWLSVGGITIGCALLLLLACVPQGGKEERVKRSGAHHTDQHKRPEKTEDATGKKLPDCNEHKHELLLAEDHDHDEENHDEDEKKDDATKTDDKKKAEDCKKKPATGKKPGEKEKDEGHDHDESEHE